MKCPQDGTDLVMMDRQGVEIDYCPRCRGVWLDRGELDKILRRSATELEGVAPVIVREPTYGERRRHDDDDDDDRYRHGYGYDPRYAKKRKRKNFLEEILDF